MAILITGATGRIGRVLTETLVNAGLRVHVVTRRPHRAHEYFGARVTAFEWHPIHEPLPRGALQGVDTIVHLMGDPLSGTASSDKLQCLTNSRVISTRRLADAVAAGQSSADQSSGDKSSGGRAGRAIRLILASSTGIYAAAARLPPTPEAVRGLKSAKTVDIGSDSNPNPRQTPAAPSPSVPPLTEDAPVHEPATALQRSILQWETAANPFQKSGSSVAVVRLGQVISRDGFPRSLVRAKARGLDIRLNDEASVPVIALADAVALFAWLYVNPKVAGVINAVAPTPLPGIAVNDVLAQLIASRYGLTLPAWLARRALGLEAELILQRQQIEPLRLLQLGFPFSNPDPLETFRLACEDQFQDIARQSPGWGLAGFARRNKSR